MREVQRGTVSSNSSFQAVLCQQYSANLSNAAGWLTVLNRFETTLTPDPEKFYKYHYVVKQTEQWFWMCSLNAFQVPVPVVWKSFNYVRISDFRLILVGKSVARFGLLELFIVHLVVMYLLCVFLSVVFVFACIACVMFGLLKLKYIYIYIHTYTHVYVHIYIYIYIHILLA